MAAAKQGPFSIDPPQDDTFSSKLLALVAPPLEQLLSLSTLNQLYTDVVHPLSPDPQTFLHETLHVFGVSVKIQPDDLARIPKTGGCIVVANHPYGGLDGIILANLLLQIRPDAKVMANRLLGRIPDLREIMLFVDVFGGPEAARANARVMRASLDHLKNGGMLVIFPAGEVSSLDLSRRAVCDPKWSDMVARLVRKASVPVLPVYFEGKNSSLFQIAGLVHPRLRTAMLPRELLNKRNKTIRVHTGSLIPTKKLAEFNNDSDMTAYLRLRTYVLQSRNQIKQQTEQPKKFLENADPIAPADDPLILEKEVLALPEDQRLIDHGDLQVYYARVHQIPHLLQEIGRQREITFRANSEGTGKSVDLDQFDEYYAHLFIWNKSKRELVGAYRIGLSSDILPKYGVKGFYTHCLFNYSPELLERLGPSMELGRSFVRPEYQRSYSPLLLLWKGIGQLVVRYPTHQCLFGPVSINQEYQSLSRQLIMNFLQLTSSLPSLSRLIRPKNPPQLKAVPTVDIAGCNAMRDLDDISDLVSEIETDQKGVPILLKQYSKLGGRILGFNVDPDFANCLDGLMLVDLRHTDARLIERFAGADGARVILAHRQQTTTQSSGT